MKDRESLRPLLVVQDVETFQVVFTTKRTWTMSFKCSENAKNMDLRFSWIHTRTS